MPNWDRMIIADDDIIISESKYDIGQQFIEGRSIAKVTECDILPIPKVIDEILEVKQLLGPLT